MRWLMMLWLSRCGSMLRLPLLAVGLLIPVAPVGAEDLLVVSRDTQEILRYDASTGAFVDTLVEPVADGFQTPAGIALHPTSGALYVSSASSGEIWEYDTASGAPVIPALVSSLQQPGGADIDAAGSFLYFVDPADGLSLNHDSVKRMAISTASVSTVGTDSAAEYTHVAVNGSLVFASDALNGNVVSYPVSGGNDTTEISGLMTPGSLLFVSATELLVAETGTDRVLEYVDLGGTWTFNRVVLDVSSSVDCPAGLALAPDGSLSVSGQFSHQVVSVDLVTLVVSPLVAAGAGGLRGAGELGWNGATLWVASAASNSVLSFDSAGNPTGISARGLSPPIDAAMGTSASGTLAAPSAFNNLVAEYEDQGGGLVRQYFDACPTSLDAPFDTTFGPDGNLYISCLLPGSVHRFDSSTGNPINAFVAPGSGGISFPQGLAFGPNGNLFVASGGTNQILEYDGTTGAFVSVFVDQPVFGGLGPNQVLFHQGALYVSFSDTDEVWYFDALTGAPLGTGTPLGTFVATGSGGLDAPSGIDFGPDGNFYVASEATDEVLEYDGATGAFLGVFVSAGSGGLGSPSDLVFVPEPRAALLLGCGIALLLGLRARRGRARRRVDR